MAKFESDNYQIGAPASELIDFISIPSNLKLILPADRIENWQESEDGCSFKIKGLADIKLKLEMKSGEQVIYASSSDKPFAFKLMVAFAENTSGGTDLSASFDADVNAFMGTMLKWPLVNFLNSLGDAIKLRFG